MRAFTATYRAQPRVHSDPDEHPPRLALSAVPALVEGRVGEREKATAAQARASAIATTTAPEALMKGIVALP